MREEFSDSFRMPLQGLISRVSVAAACCLQRDAEVTAATPDAARRRVPLEQPARGAEAAPLAGQGSSTGGGCTASTTCSAGAS